MKKITAILTTMCASLLFSPCGQAAGEIMLDEVDCVDDGTVRFTFRLTNTDGYNITGATNGFSLWTHRNGEYTVRSLAPTIELMPHNWEWMFDGGVFYRCAFSCDGLGKDTLKWSGFKMFWSGIPDGFDEQIFYIEARGLTPEDTVCIDSTFFPAGGYWLWSTTGSDVVPDWGGPYCYPVLPCCVGSHGNIDFKGGVDISDLTLLIGYIFPPHWELPCPGAGDVDGRESGGGAVNISDITYFVDYLFHGGPAPPPCE